MLQFADIMSGSGRNRNRSQVWSLCRPLAPCLVNHAAFSSVGLMCKLRCKTTTSGVLSYTAFFLFSFFLRFILPSVSSFPLCSVSLVRLRLGLFEFHLSVCDFLKEVFVKAI